MPRTPDRWVVGVLAGLAIALAFVATWKGAGLTDDSVNYLSTAVNVAEGRGWVMLADQPITIFPPGLPAIGALGEVVGLGAETTLRLVSVLSFGAIVVLGHRLLARMVPSRPVVLGSTALLATSPALLGISQMAWSEPLFIVLELAFLLALGDVLRRGSIRSADIAVLAGLASMAFLIRYIGVALVALAGLALLARLRPLDRRTVSRIAMVGLASAPVPVACMLRNRAADGTLLGKRIPSQDSLLDSGHRVLVTLGEWVYPVAGVGSRPLSVLGTLVLALLVGALVLALRAADDASQRSHLMMGSGFVVVYTAYLVVASLSTAFEPINSRYLSPVLVPLVGIGAAGLAEGMRRMPAGIPRRVIGAAPVLLIGLLAAATARDARTSALDGVGYRVDANVHSDLADKAAELVESRDDAVVYSNLPFGLWAATRLQPVQWSPLSEGFRGAPIEGELESLVARVACAPDSSFLVRYHFGHRRAMKLDGIRAALDVTRVVVADDGAIFQLTAREQVPCQDPAPRPTLRR